MTKGVIALLAVLWLGGCSSGVVRKTEAPAPIAQTRAADGRLGEITLTYTTEGKEDAQDDIRFDGDELLRRLKSALQGKALLVRADGAPHPALELQIKSVRVRSDFSAFMFGIFAGRDSISGDVLIKATDGAVIDRFEVAAAYGLGGYLGETDHRLNWLYTEFVDRAVEEVQQHASTYGALTGATPVAAAPQAPVVSTPIKQGRMAYQAEQLAQNAGCRTPNGARPVGVATKTEIGLEKYEIQCVAQQIMVTCVHNVCQITSDTHSPQENSQSGANKLAKLVGQ